jgi:hypothetical protein
MRKTLQIKGKCFVHRPNGSFSGTVADMRSGWVRIVGKGSVPDCCFDEWFPTEAKLIVIRPA